jgi:hypothetical protein
MNSVESLFYQADKAIDDGEIATAKNCLTIY